MIKKLEILNIKIKHKYLHKNFKICFKKKYFFQRIATKIFTYFQCCELSKTTKRYDSSMIVSLIYTLSIISLILSIDLHVL